MSGKYALYEPKTQEAKKEFIEAEIQIDKIIKDFSKQVGLWHGKHFRLGSADTACLEAVAAAIGREFGLKI